MLPNLIIIGAQKAGTTSLHSYLDCHPDIAMSNPKELNYFSNSKYFSKGVDWYKRHFRRPAKIRGESSTSYTAFPMIRHTPERMKGLVPDVNLIYVVRDPIDRFISAYLHRLSEGSERRTFSEIMRSIRRGTQERYVAQSSYSVQLAEYLKLFDQRQVLVVASEELRKDREGTLREVCGFLQLPYTFQEVALAPEQNSAGDLIGRNWWVNLVYPKALHRHPRIPWLVKSPFVRFARLWAPSVVRPKLTEDDVRCLTEVFRPDVQRLKELTGKSFPGWREY